MLQKVKSFIKYLNTLARVFVPTLSIIKFRKVPERFRNREVRILRTELLWSLTPAAGRRRILAGLISRPAEGRRLSWPRWLGEILR